jgi:serine/threonine protein kinase
MNSGRYENRIYVGSGGMASVYKAFDGNLQRNVAIKEMAFELRNNEETRDLFIREARKMASIKHQNVVHVYDVSDDGDVPTIIMEFMGGGNLAGCMGTGSLATEDVLKIVKQIALGLQAIHAKGLVHGDVKPENILADAGIYKITDFGVAMGGEEDALPSVTIKYAAPEVLADPNKIGPSSDIYSLGVMAVELLLGPRGFEDAVRESIERDRSLQLPAINDSIQVFWQTWVASSAELPDFNTFDSSISIEVSEFLGRLTRREQSDRTPDCQALLSELDEVIKLEGQRSTANTVHDPKLKRRRDKLQAQREKSDAGEKKKRPIWLKAGVGVGGLLILAVLTLLIIPTAPPRFPVDVESEPSGASISVNGRLLEGRPTPTRFNGAWGDNLVFALENRELIEFVLTEEVTGLSETGEGFQLEVAWPELLSIETSAEAAQYLIDRLPSAWPLDVSLEGIMAPAAAGDPTRIELGTSIKFQVNSDRAASLLLFHLGSNDLLTLIYPNPVGIAPTIEASKRSSFGGEIGLVAEEPLGTEWFVVIATEQAVVPADLTERPSALGRFTFYPIGGRGSPGESVIIWLSDAIVQGAASGKVLKVEIVAKERAL